MKNKKLILIIIGVVIVILAGLLVKVTLFKDKVEDTPKYNDEEKKSISIIDVDSKTRPYAVMINCLNEALPQSGLDKAYIVYELMVEGGITRMMALFKDQDVAKIGSVRSARTQYLGYALENDAIYAHAGGAPDALEGISKKGVDDIDVDGSFGERDESLKRDYEHTLFTSTTLLANGAKYKKLDTTTSSGNLLTYSAKSLNLKDFENSEEVKNVSIEYSKYRTSNYTYDENTKMYLRSMNDKKNTDLVTGEQYKVKNIIVYGVKYTSYTYSGYNGYQKIDNIGSGEGYYISEGYAIPITWEKASESSKTIYKVKSTGKVLVVNDGNTYIQIYPSNQGSLEMN